MSEKIGTWWLNKPVVDIEVVEWWEDLLSISDKSLWIVDKKNQEWISESNEFLTDDDLKKTEKIQKRMGKKQFNARELTSIRQLIDNFNKVAEKKIDIKTMYFNDSSWDNPVKMEEEVFDWRIKVIKKEIDWILSNTERDLKDLNTELKMTLSMENFLSDKK